ncbi:hypothetical protein [Azospirillum sp. sgz301742]
MLDDDRTDLSALLAQSDADIDYGDAPKTTPVDWANAKLVRFRFTGSRIDNRGSKKVPKK